MFNETIFLLSWDELQQILLHEVTVFHVALTYILMYVVYKALGRYIYFKPQEHTSKINRTFLAISLLVLAIHFSSTFANHLPFLPAYRWLFVLCSLVILIAPFSILAFRTIWKFQHGSEYERDWVYRYFPIPKDYFKTNIHMSEKDGMSINSWEEEGVESTKQNYHSDALLNFSALIVFIIFGIFWSFESIGAYGYYSVAFFTLVGLPICGLFVDRGIFSWIDYLENNYREILSNISKRSK
jgi:hypothetical protein